MWDNSSVLIFVKKECVWTSTNSLVVNTATKILVSTSAMTFVIFLFLDYLPAVQSSYGLKVLMAREKVLLVILIPVFN